MRIVGTRHHCVVENLSLRTCSSQQHRHWENAHDEWAIALWAHLTPGRCRLFMADSVTLGRTRRRRPVAEKYQVRRETRRSCKRVYEQNRFGEECYPGLCCRVV